MNEGGSGRAIAIAATSNGKQTRVNRKCVERKSDKIQTQDVFLLLFQLYVSRNESHYSILSAKVATNIQRQITFCLLSNFNRT